MQAQPQSLLPQPVPTAPAVPLPAAPLAAAAPRPAISPRAALLVLAIGALAPPALGQDAAALEAEPPAIVISGGLTPVPEDEFGRAATVLAGETLRRKGIATLADALREAPGLTLNTSDLSDGVVRIRGNKGDQTLILIDGVEQIADLGGVRLGGIDLADIDRIEVLRGPQAASYGAGAAAGVVAIWTRRGAEGLHYGATLEAGGATGASAWIAQRGARGGVSAALAFRDDRGWDVSGDGGEADGLTRRSARLAADFAATDELTLGLTLAAARETYDFDATSFAAAPTEAGYILDDPYPHGTHDTAQGELWAEWRQLGGRLTHRLGYAVSRDRRETAFAAGFDPAETETERRALRYRASYALDGGEVATAAQVVSLMLERVEDRSPLEPRYQRATTAAALEYRGEVTPGLALQLAVRRDLNDAYADATSWNAALAWTHAGSGVKLHASAGDGRRNPVFYELYGDGIYTVENPDLAPERNRSLDLGVTVPFDEGRGSADLTAFSERIEDRIGYVALPAWQGVYRNLDGTSTRRGVEASFGWQASDRLDLRGHATFLDAKDPDGERELRVPRREVGLGVTWRTADGRGSLSADLRHVSGVRDTDRGTFQPVELDAYTLLDVAGRWAIDDRVAIGARVENLTDADHTDVWGYAARGRTAYVGLEASF